jgi:hypothetical protein
LAYSPRACGLGTSTTAYTMLLLLKPLPAPSSSPILIVRSFEHFTLERCAQHRGYNCRGAQMRLALTCNFSLSLRNSTGHG